MAQPTTSELDQVRRAFDKDLGLQAKVIKFIEARPQGVPLMIDIAKYIVTLQQPTENESTVPPSKKRRLNGDSDANERKTTSNNYEPTTSQWHNAFRMPDVSFSIPQRKKLSLEISVEHKEGIRAVNPKTETEEFSIPWIDIEHVVCLPVPEKATVAHNFCIFPKLGDGVTISPNQIQIHEPIVWTINEIKNKDLDAKAPSLREQIISYLEERKIKVLEPSAGEFVSEAPQAQRKGEKAYHVKAFRGSKDGFLFFLSTGIVWGFKKPLHFFSFDHISSISYTSVLQRTFNLNISTEAANNDLEFEFSMIDQADFAGIDAYIKRHRLQDASMAAERKAKKLNVNGVKGEKDSGDENRDGETELEKAAREAGGLGEDDKDEEDEEDEEDDENFDPGSEGESEGSGSSSEEEDGDGGAGGEGEGGDLVEEELGSEPEAEDEL